MLSKQDIRMRIWRIMEERNIARFPRPCYHRIPNFVGSEVAAKKLITSGILDDAKIVFVNPDFPQKPIREYVILSRKTLVMPTPRLRSGFIVLEPGYVPRGKESYAATIRGAFKYGKLVTLPSGMHIDVKVTGCVAVTEKGARLGKGGGYSDLEYAILRELNYITEETPVITTVHDIQVVEHIPMTKHDVPVDEIFTPSRHIKAEKAYPKPSGVYWDELDERKILEIPPLRVLRERYGRGRK